MSSFLGPIHYWLYNKINNQEKLKSYLYKEALKANLINEKSECLIVLPRLEDAIDKDNIHGWLQNQIKKSEVGFKTLLIEINLKKPTNLTFILKKAYEFGIMNNIGLVDTTKNVYKKLEDFFLNGMPCDHVHQIVEEATNNLIYKEVTDIHLSNWSDYEYETLHYYLIIDEVMKGMLSNTGYRITKNNQLYTIEKIEEK